MNGWRETRGGTRRKGAWNSGRAALWALRAARLTAALLCAYVPLAGQLPALLPDPLLNVLALLTTLPVLLPGEGAGTGTEAGPGRPGARCGSPAECRGTRRDRVPPRSSR
ncbi:hypothetical protein [Streptomyces sp. NPDC012510]|uniref:hypothetical protein n=1 Tax=Streptomyces sp. NPDC012510 TaxID=3364838 RepID=UPI0036E13BBD